MVFPVRPAHAVFPPGAIGREEHTDGKAQVTREPTGPPGPPRPRPARAGSGPFPGAATGPIPRVPVTHGQPDDDPWSGTAPGFEFEHRRPRPARAPGRTPPGRTPPGQPGHGRVPRAHPGSEPAGPRRFRYTPTVSQPTSTQAPPQAWPGDDVFVSPGFEFAEMPGPGAGFPPPARPAHPSGPLPTHPAPRPAGRREHGPAGAEWTRLLRSLLPQPVKRRWSREFVNG